MKALSIILLTVTLLTICCLQKNNAAYVVKPFLEDIDESIKISDFTTNEFNDIVTLANNINDNGTLEDFGEKTQNEDQVKVEQVTSNTTEDILKNWVPLSDGQTIFSASKCNLSEEIVNEIASYEDNVKKIIDFVMNGKYKGRTYKTLAELVDTFGPRLVRVYIYIFQPPK